MNITGPNFIFPAALRKGVRIAVAALLCLSLYATGIMASQSCGVCCCNSLSQMSSLDPTDLDAQSSHGCCSPSKEESCSVEAAQAHELPVALSSEGQQQHRISTGIVPGDINAVKGETSTHRSSAFSFCNQNFQSAPIFVQNMSFLI